MADNITLPGASSVVATDEVAGSHYQRLKLVHGTDGTSAGDVAVTNPYPVRLGDGTTQTVVNTDGELQVGRADKTIATGSITAVDAGSTATTGQNSQSIITGTATAASAVAGAMSGRSSFALQISGTWIGTLQVERSIDDGVTWSPVSVFVAGTPNSSATITGNGAFHGSASSASNLRVRATAWTSGTATIRILAGVGTHTVAVQNPVRLFDSASGAQGTIKPASTPAAAADTALAVTMHPSSAALAIAPPTITKGAQGSTGIATQHLKDSGRTLWSAATAIAGVTAVTAEALLSMVAQRDGTAAAGATSQAVTAGKRLRIMSMTVGMISTSAAVLSARFSLRIGAAGAATATSPIVVTIPVPSGAALAQAGGSVTVQFPDGIEISGSQQIGVSQVASAATGTVWASLAGFEY